MLTMHTYTGIFNVSLKNVQQANLAAQTNYSSNNLFEMHKVKRPQCHDRIFHTLIDISERHKICRSTKCVALKLSKAR